MYCDLSLVVVVATRETSWLIPWLLLLWASSYFIFLIAAESDSNLENSYVGCATMAFAMTETLI